MSGSKEERFVPTPTPTTQNGGFFSKFIMKKNTPHGQFFVVLAVVPLSLMKLGDKKSSDTDEEMRVEVSRVLAGKRKL